MAEKQDEEQQTLIKRHYLTPEAVRLIFNQFTRDTRSYSAERVELLSKIVVYINNYAFGLYTGFGIKSSHILVECEINWDEKPLILSYIYGDERKPNEPWAYVALPLDGIYLLEWHFINS